MEQKRKVKQAHKKQHTVVLKEIRLRPKIDDHDRQIKIDHAVKFLEKGYKVQFTMLFRGREMTHVEHGYNIMEEILGREIMDESDQVADKRALARLRRRRLVSQTPERP